MYDLDHLTHQFEEASLDIKTNPSVFFTNLTKINKKFAKFKESGGKDYARDDKEMCIKICKCVAPEYKEVITAFKTNNVRVFTPKRKLDALKEALKEHWKENYSHLYQGTEKSNMILNTNTGKVCTFCSKKGHLESQCWKKHGKPSKTKSDGRKCWICESTDHVKKDCPKKKNKTEETTSMNGVFMGMALCGEVTSAKTIEWLGDTGSQIHARNSDDIELRNEKVLQNEPVTGCNGTTTAATKTGDVTVESVGGVRCELKNLRVVPGLAKNIISINQLRSEGRKLSEGKNGAMELTLNNETLRFLPGTEKHLCYLKASVVPTGQTALVVHQATTDVKEKETGTSTNSNDKLSMNSSIFLLHRLNFRQNILDMFLKKTRFTLTNITERHALL
jgi:hypothetical protein